MKRFTSRSSIITIPEQLHNSILHTEDNTKVDYLKLNITFSLMFFLNWATYHINLCY